MPFTYVVNVYSDMSLFKVHLGSRGLAGYVIVFVNKQNNTEPQPEKTCLWGLRRTKRRPCCASAQTNQCL